MFERVVIHLSGPICKCEKQDLAWGMFYVPEERLCGLLIRCWICGAELKIPPSKLLGYIVCKTGYPKGIAEKGERTKTFELTEDDKKFLRDLNIRIDE